MVIFDRLLKKIISPVINQSIKEFNDKESKESDEKKIQKGLTALAPSWRFMPMATGGLVKKTFPRGVQFRTLRDFSVYYPILRACISYRKRQITQLAWDITSKEVVTDKKQKEKYVKDAAMVKEFLKYPTGDKTLSFRSFTNKVMEDLLVLDAIAIYRRQNRKGGLYGYLPIDATTIELILNKDGTVPTPPEKAYVQKVSGEEKAKLSSDELIYRMLNPRTETPYGLSPVEALIIVVTTALKLSAYNLSYLSEGNVPEGFVELPQDIASDADQLKLWQEKWDAMFSGDPRFQRKIKFLPEGMKWHPTRKTEDMEFERFEKWLLLQTCFDDKTEILTDEGWKLFKDLNKEEMVATRNEDGFIEYQQPVKYQSYSYEGEMVSFKGKMVDLLVTPDHRMLTTYRHGKKRGFSPYKFETADSLVGKDGHLTPLTAKLAEPSEKKFCLPQLDLRIKNNNGTERVRRFDKIEIDSVDWYKFLGLWLADGWAKGNKGGEKPGPKGDNKYLGYLVGIAAKEPKKMKAVMSILDGVPFNWRRSDTSFITSSIQLWKYLYELGNVYTKRIPRYILNGGTDCLKALWEGYLLGDGHKNGDFEMANSVNKGLIDDFQEVLFKIGRNASISGKPATSSMIGGKEVLGKDGYILTVRKSQHARLRGKRSYYSGSVYDVTVPNHTIYVRRGGRAVWTGNCSILETPPQAIGFQFERGKGATEAEWEIGKERGLFPMANFLKEIFDQMIQDDLGQDHLEFVFTNLNPTNKIEEAKVFDILCRAGAVSVDEWRLGEGLNPIDCPHYIMTPIGPTFVKDLVRQSEEGQIPYLPYKPQDKPQIPKEIPEKIQQATKKQLVEELKRWKKTAKNDLKQGKSFRDFQTDIIDSRTQNLIRDGLKIIKTAAGLDQLFGPLISREKQMISAMLDLYDEVSAVTGYENKQIKANPKGV